jgi:hypothetical protein
MPKPPNHPILSTLHTPTKMTTAGLVGIMLSLQRPSPASEWKPSACMLCPWTLLKPLFKATPCPFPLDPTRLFHLRLPAVVLTQTAHFCLSDSCSPTCGFPAAKALLTSHAQQVFSYFTTFCQSLLIFTSESLPQTIKSHTLLVCLLVKVSVLQPPWGQVPHPFCSTIFPQCLKQYLASAHNYLQMTANAIISTCSLWHTTLLSHKVN